MIDIEKRQEPVIKWHFPDDNDNPTVFHLKWLSGPKEAYLRLMRAGSGNDLDYNEWLTETLINSVVQIDNWNEKTIKSPSDIKAACELLTENEIFLLNAAIKRDGDAYNLGVMEKN